LTNRKKKADITMDSIAAIKYTTKDSKIKTVETSFFATPKDLRIPIFLLFSFIDIVM
jgi:hypothetical protein